MTCHDMFHQPVSLASTEAVAEWDAMVFAFLAHGAATPVHLARLLELAPDYAAAHAIKGLFYALLGRRELMSEASAALARAEMLAAAGTVNPRERALIEALRSVLAGRPTQAVATLEEVLREAPDDTLAMKLSHALRFVLGDALGMRGSIEAVLPSYGEDHPGRGYLLGCHAFALEETGDYASAALTGRAALTLAPGRRLGPPRGRACPRHDGRREGRPRLARGARRRLGALQQLPLPRLVAQGADAARPRAMDERSALYDDHDPGGEARTTTATSRTRPRC